MSKNLTVPEGRHAKADRKVPIEGFLFPGANKKKKCIKGHQPISVELRIPGEGIVPASGKMPAVTVVKP